MSHLDPRMSWGDLVARLVREAVTRHDPCDSGNGQRRRRSAGIAGASPRRTPNETRAAGAAGGPAQRVSERFAAPPATPDRRRGGDPPAPQGGAAATERQNPIAMLASAAPPRQSRRLHWQTTPAQVAFHRARPPLLRRSRRPAPRWMAPIPAQVHQSRRSSLRRRSRHSACPHDGGPSGASAGAAAHTTREPVHSRHHIPAAAPHSRGCPAPHLATRRRTLPVIAIRSPGAAAPLPICYRSTICCQSPRAVARSRPTWFFAALLITACATATDRLRRRSRRCSASSALRARRSTALADSLQVARRDTLRTAASPACIFATASSDSARCCRGLPSTSAQSIPPVRPLVPPVATPRTPGIRRCLQAQDKDTRPGSHPPAGRPPGVPR